PAILEERRPVQGLDVHGQAFLAYHVATDRVSVGVEVADIGASGVRNGKPTRLHVPAGPDERRSCASPSNVGDLVDLEVETCLELVVAKCLHALGERELTGHARFVQVVEDGDVTEPVPGEGAVPDAGELVDGDAAGGFVSAELQNPVALVLIPVAPDGDPGVAVDIAVAYREEVLVVDGAAAGGQGGNDGLERLLPVVPTEDGVNLGLVVVELGRPAERC